LNFRIIELPLVMLPAILPIALIMSFMAACTVALLFSVCLSCPLAPLSKSLWFFGAI